MKKYQEKDVKGLNRAQLAEKLKENNIEFDLSSSKNEVLRKLLLDIEIQDEVTESEEVEVIEPEDALAQPAESKIQRVIRERELKVNKGIVQKGSVADEIRKRQAKVGITPKNISIEEIIKDRQNKL